MPLKILSLAHAGRERVSPGKKNRKSSSWSCERI